MTNTCPQCGASTDRHSPVEDAGFGYRSTVFRCAGDHRFRVTWKPAKEDAR